MQLFTREWGEGDRVAVLIHGIFSSSGNWQSLGPVLADRGYRAIAVDLPGHGRSPRAPHYSIDLYADSVLESVPGHPELAIGHSLGGLTLAAAADRLRPARAVYVDPAFTAPALPWWQRMLAAPFARRLLSSDAAAIAKSNPRWSQADVDAEADDFTRFDRKALSFLRGDEMTAPTEMVVPSLLVLADGSRLVGTELADRLRTIGFEVRVVPGAGHTVNRDDFDGFLKALDGWI
jgi:pimeloyl-ACP methyl ester carboxylesterase